MAHYALLDENNIVVMVITGKDEGEDGIDWEQYYGNFHKLKCKRTSYNTIGNSRTDGKKPFRGNFAGVGSVYDEENDVFIFPKPDDSFILDKKTWTWVPPIEKPSEQGATYLWDFEEKNWKKIGPFEN